VRLDLTWCPVKLSSATTSSTSSASIRLKLIRSRRVSAQLTIAILANKNLKTMASIPSASSAAKVLTF